MKTTVLMGAIAFGLASVLVITGCEGDGGDNGNADAAPQGPVVPTTQTTVVPAPGAWVGEGMSFRVSEDSTSLSELKVTFPTARSQGGGGGGVSAGDTSYDLSTLGSWTIKSNAVNLALTPHNPEGQSAEIRITFVDTNTAATEIQWNLFISTPVLQYWDSGTTNRSVAHQG